MSSPQEKKRKTGGSPGSLQRKRGAEEDLEPIPTLGQVAEDADFEPLRTLLDPVKNRPVNEFLLENPLAEQLRITYAGKAKIAGQDERWTLFLIACYAKLEEAAPKRAHVASEEHSPGKLCRKRSFFPLFPLSLFLRSCAPSSGSAVALDVRKTEK